MVTRTNPRDMNINMPMTLLNAGSYLIGMNKQENATPATSFAAKQAVTSPN
jgi:hypothetical protein